MGKIGVKYLHLRLHVSPIHSSGFSVLITHRFDPKIEPTRPRSQVRALVIRHPMKCKKVLLVKGIIINN